jgi:hypothetical protein
MGVSDLDLDAHGRRPWNAGNINDQQMEFFGMCDLKLISPDWGTRLSVGKHKGNGLCFIGHEASLRNK